MLQEHVVLVLLGISGVAVTSAGFAGVVATFGRHTEGEWLPEERFRLTNMLVLSLGACLFAFIPLIEEMFHIAEAALWTIASILLGTFSAAYFVYVMPERRRLNQSRPGVLRPWMAAVFIVSLSAASVLQALNAAAVFVERGAGPYVIGLSLLLMISGFQFVFLILMPLTPTASDDGNSRGTSQ
jgi:hypothetical protein